MTADQAPVLHAGPQPAHTDHRQANPQTLPTEINSDTTLISPMETDLPSPESRDYADHNDPLTGNGSASGARPPPSGSFCDVETREKTAEKANTKLKYTTRESLGSWGTLIIFGGCVGNLGVLAFISFLWFGGGKAPEAATAVQAWQSIILDNRVAQAITLSSLLLRVITSAQAISCTSMLAGLFLERRAVRASQLAYFSVARGINDGPRALLQTVIGSGMQKMLLTAEAFLILVLTLTVLGLQFSSTVLIADLRPHVVINPAIPTPLNTSFAQSTNPFIETANGALRPPFAIFGETLSNNTGNPDGWGLSDTGLKQRALIFMENPENRTTIRTYQGPATALNTRTACMRPNINGLLKSSLSPDGSHKGWLQGTLDYKAVLQAAGQMPYSCRNSECQPLRIECGIPATALGDGVAQAGLCIPGFVGGKHWSRSDDLIWKSDDVPWVAQTPVALVFTTNMGPDEWLAQESIPLVPAEQKDEWISYQTSPTRYVNVSMCFLNFNLAAVQVNMTASAPLSEPKDDWSTAQSQGGSTTLYQRFLGADLTHQSHGERGILTLDEIDNTPASELSQTNTSQSRNLGLLSLLEWSIYFGLYLPSVSTDTSTTIGICAYCYARTTSAFNTQVAVITTDIINHTRRPALALDSFLFMRIQTVYAEYAMQYDTSENATISFARAAQVPGYCWDNSGCRGYIAVSVLIGVHLVCVIWIVILYLTRIRYSKCGNIWHTVLQLQGNELSDALGKARDAKDDEIKKLVKNSSGEYLVKIGLAADGSTVGVQKF